MRKIVDRIIAGTFKFDPAIHLSPRAPGLGPRFPPGRVAALRRALLLAGYEPESAGLPPSDIFQPKARLASAPKPSPVKEAKWKRVEQQMADMPKLIEEARIRRKQAKEDKKKKHPF